MRNVKLFMGPIEVPENEVGVDFRFEKLLEKFRRIRVSQMGSFQLRPVLLCYELRDEWSVECV